jgi:hypothetical protein
MYFRSAHTSSRFPNSILFECVRDDYYIQGRLDGCDAPLRTFITFRELHRSSGLFSRATTVWKVVLLPDKGDEIPQVYALEDTWRARYRDPEVDNYNRILAHHRTEELHGLAKCHDSVGETGEIEGYHTDSARLRIGTANGDLWDRNHMRILLFPVGKPLDEFQSTRVLVEGIRDAVKGTLH